MLSSRSIRSLLVLFIIQCRKKIILTDFDIVKSILFIRDQISDSLRRRTTVSHIMVFGSIAPLACLYTYYIDAGIIVGDQWFHHGLAIIINSGSFDDVAGSITYLIILHFSLPCLRLFLIYQACLRLTHTLQYTFLT